MLSIRIRLFAGLSEALGGREMSVEVPDGATVGDLRERLAEQHPIVRAFLPTLICAVQEEYVPSDHVLRDGDEVALIPPVSGGARV